MNILPEARAAGGGRRSAANNPMQSWIFSGGTDGRCTGTIHGDGNRSTVSEQTFTGISPFPRVTSLGVSKVHFGLQT